jgi:hypothetical protein
MIPTNTTAAYYAFQNLLAPRHVTCVHAQERLKHALYENNMIHAHRRYVSIPVMV